MKKQFYRVKQLADQTFSTRSGKEEALTDELQTADKKVDLLKNALQLLMKRLSTGAGNTMGQDPAAREKRLKKIPEYLLGTSMLEASNVDDDSVLKHILSECGKTEKMLAFEIAEHELKVENFVCTPLAMINDQDLPTIMKAKKHLTKLLSEKETAANRYHNLEKQKEENPSKLNAAKDELEEAGARVESARDQLAADMFALVAKEEQLAHTLLQYVKLQRAYHESVLRALQVTVPELEKYINVKAVKPVFGNSLEEHLISTKRTIAYPIELCVCTLYELALNEEGLFRIAGGSLKVRRMKLSLDAGLFHPPLPRDYRDVHVVASVLKSYLRELPEPLLTNRLFDDFLNASRLQTEHARLNALRDAIELLPDHNYNNLRYLIKFLSTLTQNQNTNKMTPSNLAIVIAPNFLWGSEETAFDMNITTSINCIVEMLIKHADWFFKDDVNFYLTFSKEDLLPDREYGFTGFAQGIPQTVALNHDQNGDLPSMTRSMHEYPVRSTGRHSRSNSNDTSLILVEGELKKAQSNSSLSDQSSPPHGSPKPITRKKYKPLAPIPPNFTPDKNKNSDNKEHNDKPAKPPRPTIPDSNKSISGVQTINRATYKQYKALKDEDAKNATRDSLVDTRRQSLQIDKDQADGKTTDNKTDKDTMVAKNVIAQSGSVTRIKVLGESPSDKTVANKSHGFIKPSGQPPPRPVAAPRTSVLTTGDPDSIEVNPRLKPIVPERPAMLRPQSFRLSRNSITEPTDVTETVLERTHIYSVDKHHPTVIQVLGAQSGVETEEEKARVTVQRTHSSGGKDEEERSLSFSRSLSQSDGSITESPRRSVVVSRPTEPAPPPPAPLADSTHL